MVLLITMTHTLVANSSVVRCGFHSWTVFWVISLIRARVGRILCFLGLTWNATSRPPVARLPLLTHNMNIFFHHQRPLSVTKLKKSFDTKCTSTLHHYDDVWVEHPPLWQCGTILFLAFSMNIISNCQGLMGPRPQKKQHDS